MPGPYDSFSKKVNGVNTYDVFGRHSLSSGRTTNGDRWTATHAYAVGDRELNSSRMSFMTTRDTFLEFCIALLYSKE